MATGRFWGNSEEPLSVHPHLASRVKEVTCLAWGGAGHEANSLERAFQLQQRGRASHFKSPGGTEAGSRTSAQTPSVPSACDRLCNPGEVSPVPGPVSASLGWK